MQAVFEQSFKDNLLPETKQELVRMRSATAKCLDISKAIEDGYVDTDVVVSGQGFHFLKPRFASKQRVGPRLGLAGCLSGRFRPFPVGKARGSGEAWYV